MWQPFLMTPTSTRRKIRVGITYFLDLIIALAALTWIAFVELGITPHFKQGFYCNDKSISYKFKGDTVSVAYLVLSALIPIILMWITELLSFHQTIQSTNSNKNSIKINMHLAINESGRYIKSYLIGMSIKLVVVETLKIAFGELRPHFLDTCKPDIDIENNRCDGQYIEDYKCTGYTEFGTILVTDSSRSFPSGHSSVSVYEAVFMIWYFQEKFPKIRSYFLLPFLQCLCVCWACFCSISRITDKRHHWWDVLAGSIFGVLFAIFTCTVFCNKFKSLNNKTIPIEVLPSQNGSTANHHHHHNHHNHTSIKRLISDTSIKEEVILNNVTVT